MDIKQSDTENTIKTNTSLLIYQYPELLNFGENKLDEDEDYDLDKLEKKTYKAKEKISKLLVSELENLKEKFCGTVIDFASPEKKFKDIEDLKLFNQQIYICGNINEIIDWISINFPKISSSSNFYVVQEFSWNFSKDAYYEIIDFGQVPISIYGVGIYWRSFFGSTDYFKEISSQHQFQTLTESTKPTNSFRTGIYLSKVEQIRPELKDIPIKFNLLRCSTNLGGPTENFTSSDNEIIKRVNDLGSKFFSESTVLNHVLAQIYENKVVEENYKVVNKKAKIKEHSDKTKDMPRNGLMAFCTFYKNYSGGKFNNIYDHLTRSSTDYFDWEYARLSSLTKLRFRLKNPKVHPELKEKFDVTLYPNSVLIIGLKTNRLYTHEIIPPSICADKIPTRMGYVIRCSKTTGIYKESKTFIESNDSEFLKSLIPLDKPDLEGVKELKSIYFKENSTEDLINYRNFYFSLNMGDYMKPKI
jgi:hypothetical protein